MKKLFLFLSLMVALSPLSHGADFFTDREFIFTSAQVPSREGLVKDSEHGRLKPAKRASAAVAELVAKKALNYLGWPYVWAGTGIGGFDCSGLVFRLFRDRRLRVPRTADAQFRIGRAVKKAKLRIGDLVFFSTYAPGVSHVGIYIGKGRFIHASPRFGVTIAGLSDPYFSARYVGARRMVPDGRGH